MAAYRDNMRLFLACETGNIRKVKAILDSLDGSGGGFCGGLFGGAVRTGSGIDIHWVNPHKKATALSIAAERGHIEVVQLLIAKGANGHKTLKAAAAMGSQLAVKTLIDAGVDIAKRNEKKDTLLHVAVSENKLQMAEILLTTATFVRSFENADFAASPSNKVGASSKAASAADLDSRVPRQPSYSDPSEERSGSGGGSRSRTGSTDSAPPRTGEQGQGQGRGSYAARERARERDLEFVNLLNGRSQTALHIAAEKGYKDLAKLLLESGADVNRRDQNGETALLSAVRGGHTTVVELLITTQQPQSLSLSQAHTSSESDALDLEVVGKDGSTALLVASQQGTASIARLLVDAGADLCVTDIEGNSALHAAAKRESVELVSFLLDVILEPRVQEQQIHRMRRKQQQQPQQQQPQLSPSSRADHRNAARRGSLDVSDFENEDNDAAGKDGDGVASIGEGEDVRTPLSLLTDLNKHGKTAAEITWNNSIKDLIRSASQRAARFTRPNAGASSAGALGALGGGVSASRDGLSVRTNRSGGAPLGSSSNINNNISSSRNINSNSSRSPKFGAIAVGDSELGVRSAAGERVGVSTRARAAGSSGIENGINDSSSPSSSPIALGRGNGRMLPSIQRSPLDSSRTADVVMDLEAGFVGEGSEEGSEEGHGDFRTGFGTGFELGDGLATGLSGGLSGGVGAAALRGVSGKYSAMAHSGSGKAGAGSAAAARERFS